jgi:hypothetical protein
MQRKITYSYAHYNKMTAREEIMDLKIPPSSH